MNSIKESVITDFSDARSIDNFRLSANGTLEKREGFTKLYSFDAPIRGAAADDYTTYLVAGSVLYAAGETSCTAIGELCDCTFADETDEVTVFIEGGAVYIIGGGAFYRYTLYTGTLSRMDGYVPLIRRDATSASLGSVCEPKNLLTNRVKMEFTRSGVDAVLYLYGTVVSVISITTDGRVLPPDYYTVNYNDDNYVTSVSLFTLPSYVGTTLTVEYELEPTQLENTARKTLSGLKAYVLKNDYGKRLFLYGGDDGKVYTSEFGLNMKPSGETFDYFPEDAVFTVGDGRRAVHSVTALGSRTVMMTSSGIYELTSSAKKTAAGIATESFSYKTVTTELGICKSSGIILYEDELYFLDENGLCKFAYNAETFEYYTIRIDFAEHASPKRSEYGNISLYLIRKNSELWCLYDGGAYVYSLKFERWYRFTGFSAMGHMLLHCKNAAFFYKNGLYAFKDGSHTDDGTGFDAVYESKQFLSDSIYKRKTVYGFGAAFDRIVGARLICTLINDTGREFTVEFTAENDGDPSPAVLRSHVRLGNTSYVICRFVSPADFAPANVRSIMLRYREIGGAK